MAERDLRHLNPIAARGRLLGRRYVLPPAIAAALEQVFAEPVRGIVVIERSRYARMQRGVCATTRPNRILLSISGAEFVGRPELLLHEYFHVIRQWRTGYLTRWRYVVELARRGYWANRYEREAREFTAGTLRRYHEYLQAQDTDASATPLFI